MGGLGSGRFGKGRPGLPHTPVTRAAIRAGMEKAKEEGHIAPPLTLGGFEPITAAFLVLIEWRPLLCQVCGNYKIGPIGMTHCARCAHSKRMAKRLDLIDQRELWQRLTQATAI